MLWNNDDGLAVLLFELAITILERFDPWDTLNRSYLYNLTITGWKLEKRGKNDTRSFREREMHAGEDEDLRENEHDYTPKQYQTLNRETRGKRTILNGTKVPRGEIQWKWRKHHSWTFQKMSRPLANECEDKKTRRKYQSERGCLWSSDKTPKAQGNNLLWRKPARQ